MSHKPRQANLFIALVSVAGLFSMTYSLAHAHHWHPQEALTLFVIAVAAARMKVKLPGLTGTMSVNLPFVLLAVAELNLVEALLVACTSTMVQCWPKAGAKAKPAQMLFNIASMASAVALGWQLFHHGANGLPAWLPAAFAVPLAISGFFLLQTVPVSIAIALTEGGPVQEIWTNIAQLTFPYYVLSAGVASIAMAMATHPHSAAPILFLVLLVMYGSYRSFQAYFRREVPENCSLGLAKAAAAGL
jgi:hypothetical protein